MIQDMLPLPPAKSIAAETPVGTVPWAVVLRGLSLHPLEGVHMQLHPCILFLKSYPFMNVVKR